VLRVLKIVRAALAFTAFYLSGATLGLVVFPAMALVTPDPEKRRRRARFLLQSAFRVTIDALRWGRFFTLDSRRVDARLPDHPVVAVVNHPTTIDVVAILSVYRDAVVVVKHKIWTHPLLRWVFRWCEHIDGGDGSMEENLRLMEEMQACLARGQTVFVWPEGTRSPPGGLDVMQRGAFSAAVHAGVPVLPVFIRADPPVLHKEQPWYVWPPGPVDYRIEIGTEIPSTGQTSRSLQRAVVDVYRQRLGLRAAPERGLSATG